jgi:phosphoglycerate dehydrogenase-like enzyme
MVDAAALSAMKRGAIFLNAGRGATVDTAALVEALRQGQLAGACLDVTDPEPLPAGHPLWAMPNVLITAHYSGTHPGYDGKVEALFLDNLRRFLGGHLLRNVVDKQEGY